MRVARYKNTRYFALYDAAGQLVVVTLYKRGANEVMRRLSPGLTAGEAEPSASPSPVLERNEESYGSDT